MARPARVPGKRTSKLALMKNMMKPQEQTDNAIMQRVIRFDEMVPCKTAFIDARTPGSDQKENFCLIGQGVAENPDQVIHIDIPHGFNIGAARQPRGCKNSHHSHDTEEVFMIHSGKWKFTWGEQGEDGSIVLSEGDTISLPKHMFRGFENVGQDDGLMYSILGLDETGTAGHVMWAPYVFDEAKNHGLVLLEDGRLIDTLSGDGIPSDGKEVSPPSSEELAALNQLNEEDILNCISWQKDIEQLNKGGLASIKGAEEYAVIGISNQDESIGPGKMNWKHGFHLRRVTLTPGTLIPDHTRVEEEVLIAQHGQAIVKIDDTEISLNKGDVISIPIDAVRSISNQESELLDLMVVRRGNSPKAAKFI